MDLYVVNRFGSITCRELMGPDVLCRYGSILLYALFVHNLGSVHSLPWLCTCKIQGFEPVCPISGFMFHFALHLSKAGPDLSLVLGRRRRRPRTPSANGRIRHSDGHTRVALNLNGFRWVWPD